MVLIKFPDPHLFKPTEEVTVFGEELHVLLDSMWEAMKKNNGMGLAANQVSLSFRMFVMEGTAGKMEFVNPKIIGKSTTLANLREGCLSAPGEFLVLPSRSVVVQVLYQDKDGAPKTVTLSGIDAVCAQHEIDHLDGKGFLQDKSLSRPVRKRLAKKWGLKK